MHGNNNDDDEEEGIDMYGNNNDDDDDDDEEEEEEGVDMSIQCLHRAQQYIQLLHNTVIKQMATLHNCVIV